MAPLEEVTLERRIRASADDVVAEEAVRSQCRRERVARVELVFRIDDAVDRCGNCDDNHEDAEREQRALPHVN